MRMENLINMGDNMATSFISKFFAEIIENINKVKNG